MNCEPHGSHVAQAPEDSSARPDQLDLAEHPAVKAWSRLRPRHGPPLAVDRLQKKRKGCVYRIRAVGPDSSDVIAKRSTTQRIARERLIYERILPALPVSAVSYYGVVDEPGGDACWLFLSDAAGIPYSPRLQQHRVLAARWLGLLHTSAVRVAAAGCLPDHGSSYYYRELLSARDTLLANLRNPALDATHRALLNDVVRACDIVESHWTELEAWSAALPETLVHGDFAPKNMRVHHGADQAVLLPYDWGSAGWGTPAADLAQRGLSDDDWDYWAHPDLAAYAAVVGESSRVGAHDLRRISIAGKIFRVLVCINLEAPSFACDWVENAARDMQIYEAAMINAVRSAGWQA